MHRSPFLSGGIGIVVYIDRRRVWIICTILDAILRDEITVDAGSNSPVSGNIVAEDLNVVGSEQ